MSLESVVHSDPDILGGSPVFVGTRVPLRNLIDYLEDNYSIEHQQNLSKVGLGVVVIGATSNRLRDLLPMIEAIRETSGRSVAGKVQHVAG